MKAKNYELDLEPCSPKEDSFDSLTFLLISAARPTRHGELTYKTK